MIFLYFELKKHDFPLFWKEWKIKDSAIVYLPSLTLISPAAHVALLHTLNYLSQ